MFINMNNHLSITTSDTNKNSPFNINLIFTNSFIFFYVSCSATNECFSASLTLENLIQLNNSFSNFKSLNEIYLILKDYFNSNIINKLSILKQNHNILIIKCKELLQQEVQFTLTNSFYISKSLLINNNNQLQPYNFINNYQIDFNKYNNDSNLNTKIYLSHILSFILIISFFILGFNLFTTFYSFISFTPSYIVSRREMNLISSWINPNKTFKFTLLYRGSVDGDSPYIFHSKCDNKGATVTLISTRNGWRFGGYSDVPWESKFETYNKWDYKNSTNAFIFSINLKKKYNIIREKFAIFCYERYGPTFGAGQDITIRENFLTENNSCSSPSSYGKMENTNEFNGGENYFIAKEVEVYLVEERVQ